jgi:hypothetical protein
MKMENYKLKSMMDFVFEQDKLEFVVIGENEANEWSDFNLQKLDSINDYAKFLKQPLAFGMFVPCDKFDNILEEPKEHFPTGNKELEEMAFKQRRKYQQAKNRVLFKGFKVCNYTHGSFYSKVIIDSTGLIHLFWFDKITETWEVSIGLNNIESLTQFGGLELTETALKEIGILNNKTNE